MIELQEKTVATAPSTYQDWLDCFARMRELPLSGNRDFEVLAMGSFSGTDAMQAALEHQMVDTINAVLDKSVKCFIRGLNERITFNELSQIDLLFKRLKQDVHKTMFFLDLSFLSDEFKDQLYTSITGQMAGFWDDTVAFLRRQSTEYSNSDLEDAIFLIGRIRLFS